MMINSKIDGNGSFIPRFAPSHYTYHLLHDLKFHLSQDRVSS